jgi:transposase
MNEAPLTHPGLPGLQTPSHPATTVPTAPKLARPRVKPVDRSQLTWRVVDVAGLIEEDHPARAIWAFVEQLNLEPFYGPIEAVEGTAGRAPWEPRLLVSLWIYAYSRGISSARELARRCTYEPAFEWLCGLEQINHHTLSDFRVTHGPALHELFVNALGVLSGEGLVSLERVMHDGTKIKAFAGADSFRREERIAAHLEAARQQVQALEQADQEESMQQGAARQRAARERQERLEQALKELEKIRQSKSGPAEKESARASVSDPPARIMKQSDGGYAPSYNVQLSTDAANKIIVGAGVSQSASDYGELSGAVDRVEQNLGRKPQQMVTDGGFTCRENILDQAAKGVDFIGSPAEHDRQSAGQMRRRGVAEEFYPGAFVYDPQQDTYRCPAGQTLEPVGQEQRPGVVQHKYQAQPEVCQACPFKDKCCPQNASKGRSIIRAVEAPEVSRFLQKMQTPQAKEIYRQRGAVAEFPNAWIKEKLGLRQFRLRGLAKVRLEVLWACLTYNIQQWIRLRWRPALAMSKT